MACWDLSVLLEDLKVNACLCPLCVLQVGSRRVIQYGAALMLALGPGLLHRRGILYQLSTREAQYIQTIPLNINIIYIKVVFNF